MFHRAVKNSASSESARSFESNAFMKLRPILMSCNQNTYTKMATIDVNIQILSKNMPSFIQSGHFFFQVEHRKINLSNTKFLKILSTEMSQI